MDKEIKVTGYSNNKGAKVDVYSPSSKSKPHDSVHVKVNTESKTFETVTKIDGKKEIKFRKLLFDRSLYETFFRNI